MWKPDLRNLIDFKDLCGQKRMKCGKPNFMGDTHGVTYSRLVRSKK